MPALKFLLGLLVVIAITYFALSNMDVVNVRYAFGPHVLALPLSYGLLGAFAVGFLVAWVLRDLKRWKLSRELRRARRAERTLEGELGTLRRQIEERAYSAKGALLAPATSSQEEKPDNH